MGIGGLFRDRCFDRNEKSSGRLGNLPTSTVPQNKVLAEDVEPGARAANRLVRLAQSGPLEIRMLTQRVRSGTERRPPVSRQNLQDGNLKTHATPRDGQMLTSEERVAGSTGLVGSVR